MTKARRAYIWRDKGLKWRYEVVGGNWKPIDQERQSYYARWYVKRKVKSLWGDDVEIVFAKPSRLND